MLHPQSIGEFAINDFGMMVYYDIPSGFNPDTIIKPTAIKRTIKIPDINHVILKISDIDNRIIKPTKRSP